jgi:hypothetical protein
MSVSHNHLPKHQATFHHNENAQPEPAVAVWFLHGLPTTIHRKLGEDVDAFVIRILGCIAEERARVARFKSLLDPQAHADVYLGELAPDCLASLKVRHMRNFILTGLQREAGAPASTRATGTSRLRAMNQLAKITGIPMRTRKVVKAETLPASLVRTGA